MLASLIVNFYRFWHGLLHLKGAGYLVGKFAPIVKSLQSFPLRLPEGQKITLDFRDVSAFYWLNYLLGEPYEEDGLLKAVKKVAKPDCVLWDVGANCGLFSYYAAKQAIARKVIFFEPNHSLFVAATEALQPFSSVCGFQCALSDHNGTACLTVPEGGSTKGTLERNVTSRKRQTLTVDCKTGDDMVAAGLADPPDIIKIDAEGHENRIIHGLQTVIQQHQPIIFFEHLSFTDADIDAFCPEHYRIISVDDLHGTFSDGFDRTRGHNSVMALYNIY